MFAKKIEGRDSEMLEALTGRLAELESRCAALGEALARRDEQLEQLGLEQRVLARRLDQVADQSEKAAAGLLQRIEGVRGAASAHAG